MMNSAIFAYIDPGTGSLVLQMVIAAVVGAGVFFRNAVARLFGKRPKETPPPVAEPRSHSSGEPEMVGIETKH